MRASCRQGRWGYGLHLTSLVRCAGEVQLVVGVQARGAQVPQRTAVRTVRTGGGPEKLLSRPSRRRHRFPTRRGGDGRLPRPVRLPARRRGSGISTRYIGVGPRRRLGPRVAEQGSLLARLGLVLPEEEFAWFRTPAVPVDLTSVEPAVLVRAFLLGLQVDGWLSGVAVACGRICMVSTVQGGYRFRRLQTQEEGWAYSAIFRP